MPRRGGQAAGNGKRRQIRRGQPPEKEKDDGEDEAKAEENEWERA